MGQSIWTGIRKPHLQATARPDRTRDHEEETLFGPARQPPGSSRPLHQSLGPHSPPSDARPEIRREYYASHGKRKRGGKSTAVHTVFVNRLTTPVTKPILIRPERIALQS